MSYITKHPVVILITGFSLSGRKTFSELLKKSIPKGGYVIMKVNDIVSEETAREFSLPVKYFTEKKFCDNILQPYDTFCGRSAKDLSCGWEKVMRKENKYHWAEQLFKKMDVIFRNGVQFICVNDWKKIKDMKYLEEKIGEKYVIKVRITRDSAPSTEEDDNIDFDLIDEESQNIIMDYVVRNDKSVNDMYKDFIMPIAEQIQKDFVPQDE